MSCPGCNTINEKDARFCEECGRPLVEQSPQANSPRSQPYWYVLFLLPVVVIAVVIGYYKFYLPRGIAAEVNGEKITLAELEAAVSRVPGVPEQARAGLRYDALNELIAGHLILQQAHKAGITISGDELKKAFADEQATYGLDDEAFTKKVASQYGSRRAFEDDLARRILIEKFLHETVIPRGADARTTGNAVNQWLVNVTRDATVRIALTEQGGCDRGSGCKRALGHASPCASGPDAGCAGKNGSAGSDKTSPAAAAAVQYWQARHGAGQVTTRVRDFGCHIQVDIVKENRVIGSLRYQNGTISEL